MAKAPILKFPNFPSKLPKPADLKKRLTSEAIDDAIGKFIARDKEIPRINRERLLSIRALKPSIKRFHGVKVPLYWFPPILWRTKCSNKFGYLAPKAIRDTTKLTDDAATRALLKDLGDFMADPARGPGLDSNIPAGFTYFGQFVDHDVTLDVESNIEVSQDATKITNLRSPALDLDSLYGRGPAQDPFLYVFPIAGPPTAIKFLLGVNTGTNPATDTGGSGTGGGFGPMVLNSDKDLPRVSSQTAILGDPRNDENVIVSQFHQAMLRFHNRVVDGLVASGFPDDIFTEARKIVRHHYQWAVFNDFLSRVCGTSVVNAAFASVTAPVNSAFSMPVEFAVAAYRFGHSMIREQYWVNAALINVPIDQIFDFVTKANLPLPSRRVVDFNAFFDTGFQAAVHNKAKKIDSVMAPGLDLLPGFSGLMAMLAGRNLTRGLALGLPSGQGMASHFGLVPLTAAQLKSGLPAGEQALLDSAGGLLLTKTPLWYYVLREAAVLQNGNQLGPVGGRIVAETFVRMVKRDPDSFVNTTPAFAPSLPSAVAGTFTVGDIVNLTGITAP